MLSNVILIYKLKKFNQTINFLNLKCICLYNTISLTDLIYFNEFFEFLNKHFFFNCVKFIFLILFFFYVRHHNQKCVNKSIIFTIFVQTRSYILNFVKGYYFVKGYWFTNFTFSKTLIYLPIYIFFLILTLQSLSKIFYFILLYDCLNFLMC